MIMKKTLCLIIAGIAINACAQVEPPKHDWNVTLKVVDEAGRSVTAAKTQVFYLLTNVITGFTDTNGIFTASHQDGSENLAFQIETPGYYSSLMPYHMGRNYKPEIWNPMQTIVLKIIGKPIPMYARKTQIEIPALNEPIGFDLIAGDWVAPYGKGKQSDFIFEAQRRWASRNDFDSTVKLTFSNAGNGMVPVSVPLNQGSQLRLSATAPSEGYIPEFIKSLSHTPANGWKDNEREGNKEQNYYFRVRTVLDEQGSVKSALYGKIHGDFALDPINSKTTWILFIYYLNPEPNSRNVEFDPKRNLIENLKPDEAVSAP